MTDPSRRQGSTSRAVDNNSNDHNNHRVRFAEEGSAREAQPSPAPPPGPAVYWDDQESVAPTRDNDRASVVGTANTANLAQYTFYREPTPPPYHPHEKGVGGYGAYVPGGTAGGESAGGAESESHLRPVPSAPGQQSTWSHADSDEEMSPAAKRRAVWIIGIVGIIVIVGIAVGVGVGLTVGMRSKSAPAEPQAQGSSSLPITATGSSPTPTFSATLDHSGSSSHSLSTSTYALSATSTLPPIPTTPIITNSDCPALNNTIYQVPGSGRSFLRLCGIDYSGSGAKDLAHVYAESMAQCINACASFDQCTACGWGYQDGDVPGRDYRCYMKTSLKTPHRARSDWCFAILQ